MKIYALSDLHVDYPQNRQWVHALGRHDFSQDYLILAGDVTDKLPLLEEVLQALQSSFREVFFVPGNHEMWIDGDEFDCSLAKFHAVQSLCQTLGVHIEPFHGDGFSIVPLLSWYDFSFGSPDRYLRRAWRDFRACRWPGHLDSAGAVTDFFLALNDERLHIRNETVISFSHFLPSLAVMPERIPPKRRKVYPVLGSERLGEQLASLRPDIHVYGHSHVNQSIDLDGTRFVNNAFAYPAEERIARKALHCVWETGA